MHDDTVPPVEDARGPHLPDVVTRNWAPGVFVLLAIGYVVWYATHLTFAPDASLADFVVYVLQAVPATTAILLPAAILLRHPDAWSTVRTLLFGAILYAVVQAMLILADPLQAFFETLTPATDDLPFLVPSSAIYNGLISVVAAFGLGYMAVGLSIARRYTDTRSRWVTGWFVPVATIFATVVGVIAVSRLDLSGTPMTPPLAIYLGSSVILGVLRFAVWAFLSSVVTRGWLEGEEPRSGWGLASIGTWLVLLTLAIVNVTGVISIADDIFGTLLGYFIVIAYAGGHLLLLLAFLVGLPKVEVDETEDDEDDEDDEDGDVFEDDDFEDEDGDEDDASEDSEDDDEPAAG